MQAHRPWAGAVAVVAVLTLASCGADDRLTAPETPAPETPAPDTPAVREPAAGVPPFASGTELQSAEAGRRSLLVLADVRVGRHDGFDRVVMDFRGRGAPGWAVNFVDRPRADGSGSRVPVRGDAYLDVYASGTTYDPDSKDVLHGPVPTAGGVVGDAYVVGTFEGVTQVLLGIDGGAVPFRVFRLADPPRLVVDVRSDA